MTDREPLVLADGDVLANETLVDRALVCSPGAQVQIRSCIFQNCDLRGLHTNDMAAFQFCITDNELDPAGLKERTILMVHMTGPNGSWGEFPPFGP